MADGVNESEKALGQAESSMGEAIAGAETAATDVGGAILEGER